MFFLGRLLVREVLSAPAHQMTYHWQMSKQTGGVTKLIDARMTKPGRAARGAVLYLRRCLKQLTGERLRGRNTVVSPFPHVCQNLAMGISRGPFQPNV